MPKLQRKSWQAQLADDHGLPRVVAIPPKLQARWGEGTLVIPAPRAVDALMRRVRKGRVVTVAEMRVALARRHGATIGCPLTTGIFAWIAAHAAAEAEAAGCERVTPWWRTLKPGGELNPKFPGGVAEQERRLAAEGHRLVRKGKRVWIADFDRVRIKNLK